MTHEMTARQYRTRHGLTQATALAAAPLSRRLADAARENGAGTRITAVSTRGAALAHIDQGAVTRGLRLTARRTGR